MKPNIPCDEFADLINEKLKESEEYHHFITKDLNLKSKIMEISFDKTKHAETLLKMYPTTCKNEIKFPEKNPIDFDCNMVEKKISDESKGIAKYMTLTEQVQDTNQSTKFEIMALDGRKNKIKLMVMKKDMGCEKNYH